MTAGPLIAYSSAGNRTQRSSPEEKTIKGYLILSEARSGTSWLASLANATGVMGQCKEWLGTEHYEKPVAEMAPEEFYAAVFDKASTENGRFAIKMFPRHLHYVRHTLGFDFVRRCVADHSVKIMCLTRRERLKQAVSFVRSIQTAQWASHTEKKGEERYDFEALCQAYFYIGRSYMYWESYLQLLGLPHETFVYEDLIGDPSAFMNPIREALEVDVNTDWKSNFRIQRDEMTEEWMSRFQSDAQKHDVVALSGFERPVGRSPRNLMKFLRKEQLRIPYQPNI
ncbi:MAG: Stf0 family sulfotransferase [Paracoccaceae bacterium]